MILIVHLRRRRGFWRMLVATAAAGVLASACAGGAGLPGPAAEHHSPVAGARPGPAPASPLATRPAATPAARQLTGIIIGIDPGHNGGNFADPSYLGRPIWNGREWEACNTTGTQTNGGYTEARFNFGVATFLRRVLQRHGGRVVMTRSSDSGVGPCVNRRAQIINSSHPAVAIDIHADGGPESGRGFTVLEPVADGPNDKAISASLRLGRDVRAAFLRYTSMPVSTYDGVDGFSRRDNLAGLNLTRVPEVLIECGNMRNPTDAALLTSARFQEQIAAALLAAILRFLAA